MERMSTVHLLKTIELFLGSALVRKETDGAFVVAISEMMRRTLVIDIGEDPF